MKAHTDDFKQNICRIGKILDSKITYELNGETIELGNEELNFVNPHYEANILKSVMKQLDIDSSVEIPIGTIVNYQFGVKINDNFEYINYGNYIVHSVDKQEDLKSYKITCYDKMLYSMVDYVNMNITYPITIRDYINAICTHLGLTFKNLNDTFANYNKQIHNELYLDSDGNSWGYKFRDVLDELAEVTASTICINEDDDELEIRYISQNVDEINEEFFKDTNVNFGEKYGPINSIVLSRSAGADNVYIRDEQSVTENGLCEIKIKDNQIMNFNDRSEYLSDILSKLDGLEYYVNSYVSPGIMYFNVCDKYTAKIGEKYYICVMFNDDPMITQGLQENVYTNLPLSSETDYSKGDKTDIRINQTYLIVDKQNQIIESVVTNVTEQNNKISKITQTVDEINSKISDIADITISGESSFATFDLDGINQSEPIMIKVHSTGENICYLYPRDNLYPEDTLYAKNRTIRFYNKTTGETFDYELPDDLLYFDNSTYDEFYLDYDSQTCQITKRCAFNADGTVRKLDTEVVTDYPYPHIELSDGDYTISILSYQYGYIFTRLMSQNIYTSQFATKAELSSSITQTKESIDLSVNQKLSDYSTTNEMNAAINLKANEINSIVSTKVGSNEIISKINQSAEQVSINANKVNLTGYITATNLATSGQTTINGDNIKTGNIESQNYVVNESGTKIDLSNGAIDSKNFKLDSNGNATFKGIINGGSISVVGNYTSAEEAYIECTSPESTNVYPIMVRMWNNGLAAIDYSQNYPDARLRTETEGSYAELHNGECNAFEFNNISLAEKKENFEKLKNALDIIKKTDIYKFNYKKEQRQKKHIGLVIGNKYNYSKEVTNEKNDAVDLYSMVGVCFQAIKEQQEEIEKLKKEMEELKNGKN